MGVNRKKRVIYSFWFMHSYFWFVTTVSELIFFNANYTAQLLGGNL